MKKILKAVLCLAMIAIVVLAPGVAKDGPPVDDRPISYAYSIRPSINNKF